MENLKDQPKKRTRKNRELTDDQWNELIESQIKIHEFVCVHHRYRFEEALQNIEWCWPPCKNFYCIAFKQWLWEISK